MSRSIFESWAPKYEAGIQTNPLGLRLWLSAVHRSVYVGVQRSNSLRHGTGRIETATDCDVIVTQASDIG
jgi:hypothetical protein